MQKSKTPVISTTYERYGTFFPSNGLYWFADEGGEIQTEVTEKSDPVQSFSVDDIDLETKVQDKEEETEVEIEGKKEVSTDKSEVSELKKQIQELQGDLLKLAMSKTEQVKPLEKGEKKEKISRAQLVQLMKEHKDDPEVLYNISEYIAEQKAEELRDATIKDVNQRQWHSNLSGMANRIMSEDEDGYLAANPKIKASLDEYAQNLGMGDHPVGRLAAYAILRLSEGIKTKGKEEKVDKPNPSEKTTTNKGKMDKTRLTPNQDKTQGLNAEQIAMAKRFGVKPETYAKFVGRG